VNEKEKEKQVVIDFLKEEKEEPVKNNIKMNSTVNGYGRTHFASSVNAKQSKGLVRGQSLNYGKKNGPHVLMESNNQKGKVSYENYAPGQLKTTSKLANQFLTFKL